MKIRNALISALILAGLLAACGGGAPAQPTQNPMDIQSTAVAAASTIMAATQMALPSATPLPPPTETPLPLPTPLPTFTPDMSIFTPQAPLPQLPLPVQPSPTSASLLSNPNLGECNRLINLSEAGPTFPVKLQNQSGGYEALVSLYLNKNAFGQCGYMPEMVVHGSMTVSLPTGGWYFFALLKNKKGVGSGQAYGNFTVNSGGNSIVVPIIKR